MVHNTFKNTFNIFTSTNAKEIGTLYLIFAVFAGKFIMPALNFAICWKYFIIIKYLKLINKQVKILINKTLSRLAVNHLLRDFTQKSLNILYFLIKLLRI